MIDTKKQNKGVHPVAAGVAGAIIGAGVAVVAAVAMKDEKTQKKVNEVLDTVKHQAKEYLGKVKTQTNVHHERELDKKIEKGKKQIANITDSIKKTEENHDAK